MAIADPRLFGRKVTLRAGPAGFPGLEWDQDDARIVFSMKKDTRKGPNKATIKIWNRSKATVEFLSQKGIVATLLAGYGSPSVIFSGDIIDVQTPPGPPDAVTTIKVGDGELAYARAEFNRSFGVGTELNKIFAAIALEMGLSIGAIPLLPPRFFPTGTTFLGTARAALDRITQDVGATWSIQDGFLQILLGDLPSGDIGAFLSAETGLLVVEPIKDSKRRYRVTALLQPLLKPGKQVSIVSRTVTGIFVIRVAEYKGDTHEGDFVAILEVTPSV